MKKFTSKLSKVYNFFKLVNILRGWEQKYTPKQYDKVISDAFVLINKHDSQPGVLSPPFTLPNNQLDEPFIIKFFRAAEDNCYTIVSNDSRDDKHTKFNLTR